MQQSRQTCKCQPNIVLTAAVTHGSWHADVAIDDCLNLLCLHDNRHCAMHDATQHFDHSHAAGPSIVLVVLIVKARKLCASEWVTLIGQRAAMMDLRCCACTRAAGQQDGAEELFIVCGHIDRLLKLLLRHRCTIACNRSVRTSAQQVVFGWPSQ